VLQTLNSDPKIPSDFLFLSPLVPIQPLPDPLLVLSPNPLPISPPHQDFFPSFSTSQDSLAMSLPTIILHNNTSPHTPDNDFATHSLTHQQPSDNDLDMIIAEDPPTPDHPGYSGSDTSAHLPPSSNIPTEVSSAVTSDSNLPPYQKNKLVSSTSSLLFLEMKPILYGLREREIINEKMKKSVLKLCTRKRSGESQNVKSYMIISASISRSITRGLGTRRKMQAWRMKVRNSPQ